MGLFDYFKSLRRRFGLGEAPEAKPLAECVPEIPRIEEPVAANTRSEPVPEAPAPTPIPEAAPTPEPTPAPTSEPEPVQENLFGKDDLKYQFGTKEKGTRASGADPYTQGGGNSFKAGPSHSTDEFWKQWADSLAKGDKWTKSYKAPEKWTSAGGVVLHGLTGVEPKYVYVVKPSNNHGPWTFPKGRVDEGETKEQTAVREVWEEAGLKAKILPNGYLGVFEGTMSKTHFYMMVRVGGSPLQHGWESEAVKAVTIDEAIALFKKSGNKRDGEVAEKARAFAESLMAKMKGGR